MQVPEIHAVNLNPTCGGSLDWWIRLRSQVKHTRYSVIKAAHAHRTEWHRTAGRGQQRTAFTRRNVRHGPQPMPNA